MGRPWGPIRAHSAEGRELARFLRALVDASGMTMTAIAGRINRSRTQVGSYLAGSQLPERDFVLALVATAVPEPRLRERRQAEALGRLRAAQHPAAPAPVGAQAPAGAAAPAPARLAVELAEARRQQIDTYDRLTRSLEQQAVLERTSHNSAQLVMALLYMINKLEQRVHTLSAERDELRGHGRAYELEQAQRQLERALDQERRAREELRRAEDKQRRAEELAARVQEQARRLTDELDRLRAGDTGTHTGRPRPVAEVVAGAADADPVGDDIEQALAKAAAVNDADGEAIERVSEELGQEALPVVPPVPDNRDNPATGHPAARARIRARAAEAAAAGPGRAVRLWELLVADAVRALGPDDPETLAICGNHARTVGGDDPARALRLYENLLPRFERVMGPDHRETLVARNGHALNVGDAGGHPDAVRLLEVLIGDCERVLGPDHPETLAARNNHACNAGHAGTWRWAAELFGGLVEDRRRVLGAGHPDTLATRRNHAYALGRSGSRTEAAQLLDALVLDHVQLLGPDHPETLATRRHRADLTRNGQR
ncbi:tetratricopeptide repeat protein [Kitasatospora sp. NPDC017646]|uniref:tetratricopeptide repeat protein n=1 Tax=Kitasatospora sp. NPDC017646 TaxID=3364024 RepID=UPI00379C27BE